MPTRSPRLLLAASLLLVTLGLAAIVGPGLSAEEFRGDRHKNEHISVEAVAETTTVQPGASFLVGLKFVIDEHWHIYWENPGGGSPTTYKWKLPSGWTAGPPLAEGWVAGPILWPAPKRSELLGMVGYGYEGTFVLPTRVTVPADAPEGKVRLVLQPEWVVCHDTCLQSQAPPLKVDVVVSKAEPKPSDHKPLFDAARKLWPAALPSGLAVSVSPLEKGLALRLRGSGPWSAADADLYLYPLRETLPGGKEREVVDVDASQTVSRDGDATTIALAYPKARKSPPARLRGVLVAERAGERFPFEIDVAVEGAAVAAGDASPTPTPPTDTRPPAPNKSPSAPAHSLWVLLFFAFVGGLILNLMPCVLPVLSIKILGFVSQADEDPARVRRHGYAFAVGVLASFWILAGAIQAFKTAGDQVGWGFQLQYPGTNAALAALMVAVGLNLFGVFEMGTSVMNMAGSAAGRIHSGGYAGSFWSGMLATAIATPCSAPFMAPAVGYAMTAPALESFLLFTSLAMGMAAPYVVLTANPRLLKKVPRPGPWMETFKRLLAFPMFAVAAWLVSVVGAQTGLGGVEYLLYGLVVLGVGLWIYGNWGGPEQPARVRRIVGYGVALIVVGAAVALIVTACLQVPAFVEDDFDAQEEGTPVTAPTGQWQAWSERRVKRYLDAGYPVFVDYTADWCLSCKAYKRAFIDRDEVYEVARRHQVALLIADFTALKSKRGQAILTSLESFQRASVPLFVMHSPAPNAPPDVRDVLTSTQDVIDMMTHAATQPGVPVRTASLPPAEPAPNGK